MKIKTHRRRLCYAILALAILFSGGYFVFTTSSKETYALDEEGNPETFEEFQTAIADVYAERDRLQTELSIIKKYDNVKPYQEIWDVLDRYIATESFEWISSKVQFSTVYTARYFQYDGTALQELVTTIQKYDPNFQLSSNISYNNIVSSILNCSVMEISTVAYDMLRLGHINLMLNNAQTHFDKNYSSTQIKRRQRIVPNFLTAINDGFEYDIALYARMAELYNRIISRNTFTEVQAAFQDYKSNTITDNTKLADALRLLQHAEDLTTEEYFPYKVQRGFKRIYFGADLAEDLGRTYTLAQLIDALPNRIHFPTEIDLDETIAFFTSILDTETQNLKDALLALHPDLTNLDDKSVDELIMLSKQLNPNLDTTPTTNELANLLVQFNTAVLNLSVTNPADKYFPFPATSTASAMPIAAFANNPVIEPTTASQISQRATNRNDVYDYYGRIGQIALQIDPTITEGLYPHADWTSSEDPTNPTEPSNPTHPDTTTPNGSQTSSDSANPSGDHAPSTGVAGSGSTNSSASSLGIAAIAGIAIIAFLIRLSIKALRRKSKH